MSALLAAPLAVWDVREDPWWDKYYARRDWLKAAGLPARKMYRVEFFLFDAPFARIFCYALNKEGCRHWAPGHAQAPHDHDACSPVYEAPCDVLLEDLPPRELW